MVKVVLTNRRAYGFCSWLIDSCHRRAALGYLDGRATAAHAESNNSSAPVCLILWERALVVSSWNMVLQRAKRAKKTSRQKKSL